MKLQCDVCSVEPASVLCCADEAVLCSGCDSRIHSANKLAGKHRRFALSPSIRPIPLCDICKENKGLIFCQEDRAILCRDCDAPIHAVSVHAGRHSRFLLTGIKLSAAPISSSSSSSDDSNGINRVSQEKVPANFKTTGTRSKDLSISDYLMKMLPGWRVDDFLFDDPAAGESDSGAGFFMINGAQPGANTEVAAPPDALWHPAEEASTVPELSQFDCNCRNNNKRPWASLWF